MVGYMSDSMQEILKATIMKSWDDGIRDGKIIIVNSLEKVLQEQGDIDMMLSDFIDVVKHIEFPEDKTELYDKKFK